MSFYSIMEDTPHTQYVNLVTMARLGSPIKLVMKNLSLVNSIYLASTNQSIRDHAIYENKELKRITESGWIDLNIFPNPINRDQIESVNRTFPDLIKIKVNLVDVEDEFLDNLRIFKKLQKLSVELNEGNHNYNLNPLPVKNVTCKAQFYHSNTDCIYSLLRQISCFKKFSIYKGSLSIRTITLLNTRNIEALKIHNSIIKNGSYLVRMILNNKNLRYLKLTTDNLLISSYPTFIASDVINRLHEYRLNIERLIFTLDQMSRIKYENLKYLKDLRQLKIYYSVANKPFNLASIIHVVSSLRNVETTFVEYLETDKAISDEILETYEERSYYYKNVIESQDKYLGVCTVDYKVLRKNRQNNFLN